MNNKLYQKYLSLKIEDSNFFYLFQTPQKYIFIANDATRIAPLLNLELTNFNSVLMKCEFPSDCYKLYCDKMNDLKINFKIITISEDIFNCDLETCINSQTFDELISNFLNVEIDDLSISQAYSLLNELQNKIKEFKTH